MTLYKTLYVFTYAARYSAFNYIEHLWSPLSNKLTRVVFTNKIKGEKAAPINQSRLSKQEQATKEKQIFDDAMLSIERGHWHNVTFDGSKVHVKTVKCGEDELLFTDYERVKEFLKCPLREIHKFSDLR